MTSKVILAVLLAAVLGFAFLAAIKLIYKIKAFVDKDRNEMIELERDARSTRRT